MRILDKNGIELQAIDEAKGYLVDERILVNRHEAIAAEEEEGHWVTVKEYPNGGKDIAWIVDKEAVEAKEAWDEYEDILRFVEFNASELIARRIAELKSLLASTDYKILKVVEGAATLSEIAETIKQRAAWRKEINKLEEDERCM